MNKDMQKTKEWREISRYGGLYLVSNDGEVFSTLRNKTMKPYTINSGYKCVHLKSTGGPKAELIHRLVAEAFVPNENQGENLEVNHINFDRTDNRACNLEWVSHKANCEHSHKRRVAALKKRKSPSKLGVRMVYQLPYGRYRAAVRYKGKTVYVGVYASVLDAINARDIAEMKVLLGEDPRLKASITEEIAEYAKKEAKRFSA